MPSELPSVIRRRRYLTMSDKKKEKDKKNLVHDASDTKPVAAFVV